MSKETQERAREYAIKHYSNTNRNEVILLLTHFSIQENKELTADKELLLREMKTHISDDLKLRKKHKEENKEKDKEREGLKATIETMAIDVAMLSQKKDNSLIEQLQQSQAELKELKAKVKEFLKTLNS